MAALYSANTQIQQLLKTAIWAKMADSTAAARLLECEAYFEAVAVADRDTILSVSRNFAELFGYEPGGNGGNELAGTAVAKILQNGAANDFCTPAIQSAKLFFSGETGLLFLLTFAANL